jgi:hypothetical protein
MGRILVPDQLEQKIHEALISNNNTCVVACVYYFSYVVAQRFI